VVLTAAAAVLLLAYGLVFPTQVAIVGVVLTLPLIIMLHEAGHFFTAKRTGMKVTEFFIGFGPRIWSIKRGETEYGVKAVVLGGYCRIIGMTNLEDVDPEDEPRAYRSKGTSRGFSWPRPVRRALRDRAGLDVLDPARRGGHPPLTRAHEARRGERRRRESGPARG
jgi:membrane-associated protease RseP (regulator of RpoE activity)